MTKRAAFRYKKALAVCTQKLSDAQGGDPEQSALCFFRLAVALSRLGQLPQAIRAFSNAFMIRSLATQPDQGVLWRQFHDVQMTIYILGKRNKGISTLAEGDMIHDLIQHRWEQVQQQLQNSQIPFAAKDMIPWFQSIRIDFPWEMEDMYALGESDE